ncbi:MAG: site-specific integrase [Fimbriimonadaceae bacterium]|nr:site-specific integrase [Fimbriimonadaceae bacterium]
MPSSVFRPRRPKTQDADIVPHKGLYLVNVRLRRESGEEFRKQARCHAKAEARKKRNEFYEEFNILEGGAEFRESLVVVETGYTLGAWLEECVSTHWPKRVPATAADYAQVVKRHIIPELGEIRLTNLTANTLRKFLYALADKEVARSGGGGSANRPAKLAVLSVKRILTALSSGLSIAVECGLIASNPAIGLKMRWEAIESGRKRELASAENSEDEPEKRLLSTTEVERLLEVSKGTIAYPLVLMQTKLGLRIGEALGLRTEDLDLSGNVVRVRRQLQRIETLGEPSRLAPVELKTKNARREIPMPESVRHFAATLKPKQPVVRTVEGGWMEPRRGQRELRAAFEKAGLCGVPGQPDPTSHSLRFFWTSHLLNDLKVPVTVVSRLAGHAQIQTTLTYYSEATEGNLKDAMALIE